MFASDKKVSAWGRRLGAPTALSFAACLIYALPGANRALEYDRVAIAGGEWWRLASGHWTHGSLDHLLWDVAVFALLGAALAARDPRLFCWTALCTPLVISALLLLFQPQWQLYRGLSGVDAALFSALAVMLWRRSDGLGRRLALAGLILLGAKVAFEEVTGMALFASNATAGGGEVVPLAHLAGAATGGICALLFSGDAGERRREAGSAPGTEDPRLVLPSVAERSS